MRKDLNFASLSDLAKALNQEVEQIADENGADLWNLVDRMEMHETLSTQSRRGAKIWSIADARLSISPVVMAISDSGPL